MLPSLLTIKFLTPLIFPNLSTGETLVPSTHLRIKVNADHAGHSQLLLASKELTKSQLENFSPSPNNNSLIALDTTLVATVETSDGLSSTLKTIPLKLKLPIHTRLLEEHANTKKVQA
jgi:hypothetical protein